MAKKGTNGTKLPKPPKDRRQWHPPPGFYNLDPSVQAEIRRGFLRFYR